MTPDPLTPSSLDDALLDRYLAGELDRAEHARVETMLYAHPAREATLDAVRVWIRDGANADHAKAPPNVSAMLAATMAEIERMPRASQSRPATRSRSRTFLAVTAGCALVAVGAVLQWNRSTPDRARHYQTAPAQRATVRLADGSTMLLAPATSVTVTSTEVQVTGEAYFTIAPATTRPFVVRTNNALIQVLGTRFSVRRYQDDATSRIVVEDGRVALRALYASHAIGARTVVSARMMAHVLDSGVTVTPGITPRDYIGWTQGTLVFQSVPLRDVVTELARAYGATIRIADSTLAAEQLRMDVSTMDSPLAHVLDMIGEAMDAHYTRDGAAFVLVKGRSATRVPHIAPHRRDLPQPEKQYGR